MTEDRRVGVKELKNRLSAFLREVRRGRRILVTDRGEVVAEIRRASSEEESREALLARWREDGVLRPALREKRPLSPSPVKLPAGTAREILDELRGGDPVAGGE